MGYQKQGYREGSTDNHITVPRLVPATHTRTPYGPNHNNGKGDAGVTKAQLEAQIKQLERVNDELLSEVDQQVGEILDLEHEKDELENQLIELRGILPELPDTGYRHDAAGYIQEFNRVRHLKEIPQ
jgi:hypothetical protein